MEQKVSFKVYYEDTDCLGIVYHANYLKYFERGRTEFIESFGKKIGDFNTDGYFFVVYSMKIRFRKPAYLGDVVDVISKFRLDSEFRGLFYQRIERSGELLVDADVEVVCLDKERKLREFPSAIVDKLEKTT